MPSRYVTSQLGQLSLASLRGRVPASARVRAGMSPLPLYDLIWHVSSRSGEPSCELLYSVYVYLFLPLRGDAACLPPLL